MARYKCALCDLTSDLILSDKTDLRGTLDVLLNRVLIQFGVHAADVLLYTDGMRHLAYASGRGFRTPAFEHSTLRLGDALAGQVARERRIVFIPDLTRMNNELARAPELANEGLVAYVGVPLVVGEQMKGVLELFHRDALNPKAEWLETLEDVAARGATALNDVLLIRYWQHTSIELAQAYDATVEGWARALELRDYEPKGHTQRVTEMTVEFARIMGVGKAELAHIRRGALLHDVGKMGIPDSILLKPGSLTEADWEIMRQHPVIAYEQLLPIEFLRPALDIPYCHHEKWDGTGYPRGLAGEQIPLAARLFALVDVWDSLGSHRPYRKAWPEEKVQEYIRERAGKQFDPKLAKAFLKLLQSGKSLRRRPFGSDATRRAYREEVFIL